MSSMYKLLLWQSAYQHLCGQNQTGQNAESDHDLILLAPVDAECLQGKLFAQMSHNANTVDTQTCDHALLTHSAKALVTV